MEHYSEDGSSFEEEIADLMDLRQVTKYFMFYYTMSRVSMYP